MLTGILGRKIGMTQIFTASGSAIPVTVIEAGPCTVTQVKTMPNDGYEAIQIGFGSKKKVSRPEMGHLGHNLAKTEAQRKRQQTQNAKAREEARARGENALESQESEEQITADSEKAEQTKRSQRGRNALGPFEILREVQKLDASDLKVGQVIDAGIFAIGEHVDIVGTSKGKGFTGVMKRHGFRGGKRTHGQSDRLRAPGSIGAGTTPGRVLKGMRMAGRVGNERITTRQMEVIQSDASRNLIVVKGSIPGPNGGVVLIKKQVEV